MNIAERLRSKMLELGLNESELGRRADVPQPTINRILSGESASPRRPTIEKIARVLKVSPNWLMFGGADESKSFDANIEMALQPSRSFSYPEISWVQAGTASEAMELCNVSACTSHTSDVWAGEHGFWLKVMGPSMTSPVGPSFPEGFLILVAPEFEPRSGQFVVAKLIDSNEATFKQFIRDSGTYYLKPLNPSFPTIPMDDAWVVVGTVVDGKMPKSIFR